MAIYEENGSINSTYTLQFLVNEVGYDIVNNTSTVSYNLKLISTTYNFSDIGMTALVYINGNNVLNTYAQRTLSKNSELQLVEGQEIVTHDADGKKTITVEAYLTMNATESYVPRKYCNK